MLNGRSQLLSLARAQQMNGLSAVFSTNASTVNLATRAMSTASSGKPGLMDQVRALRAKTGAPVLECKNALEFAKGDEAKAMDWLKEKSKSVMSKKSDRVASAGLVGAWLSPDQTVCGLAEVNCETDFVARNADFQVLVASAAKAAAEEKPLHADEFLTASGKIRENLVLGNTGRVAAVAGAASAVGLYVHGKLAEGMGSIAAAVAVSGLASKDVAKDIARHIAMHVVGANPEYLSVAQLPDDVHRAEIVRILSMPAKPPKEGQPAPPPVEVSPEQVESMLAAIQSGVVPTNKADQVKQSMLRGRLQKFYADKCLMSQSFMLGELEGKTIQEVLKGGGKVDAYLRVQVGGGATRGQSE